MSSGDAGAAGCGEGSCGRIDLLEQAQREAFDQGEAFRAVVFADAALVVGEADVEAPVQLIFDAPMAADEFTQPRPPGPPGVEAGEVIATLDALPPGREVEPFALDADDAPQVDPVGGRRRS